MERTMRKTIDSGQIILDLLEVGEKHFLTIQELCLEISMLLRILKKSEEAFKKLEENHE